MDDDTLRTVAVETALNGIARARHLFERLTKADAPPDVLTARLVEGAFDCAGQLRTVPIFALRMTMPLADRDWSLAASGHDAAALAEQIDGAERDIRALTAAEFDGAAARHITHKAGDARLTQTAADYVLHFAIPNMWFHLSMAYSIARLEGAEIGKADFDGLHVYAPGFSFV